MLSSVAVSYTHLDVYKRQSLHSTNALIQLLPLNALAIINKQSSKFFINYLRILQILSLYTPNNLDITSIIQCLII